MSSNDRFGFYTVDEFKTYSKLEAIEYSGRVKKAVEWNFNKEIFSKFNWTQEPPGSLEFWYAERARQIREKYDYLVLWYSGGADSHNALMSFVKNNIFIDEIAQFHNLEAEQGNKKTWLNDEVFSIAAPITQELIEANSVYANTKHRMVDVTQLQLDVLTKDNNKWDYFYKVGKYLSPNALARSYIREVIPDYKNLIDQGKRVCFIYGAEKPVVEQNGNSWYIAFNDMLDYAVSPRTQILNRPWEHNELFYWSDTMPQLIAKQAHVVKRFMSQLNSNMVDDINVCTHNPVIDSYGNRKNFSAATATIDGQTYYLLFSGLHRLIYPYWNPAHNFWSKPYSLAYSARDYWMFNSQAPNIGQNYYNYGLLKLRNLVKSANSDYWWEYKFNAADSLPYNGGMKSFYNKYCISQQ